MFTLLCNCIYLGRLVCKGMNGSLLSLQKFIVQTKHQFPNWETSNGKKPPLSCLNFSSSDENTIVVKKCGA
jgi:hypothetical protein